MMLILLFIRCYRSGKWQRRQLQRAVDEGNWKKETDFVKAGRYSAVAFSYGQ
jgi:hypothetical protein